MCKTNNAHARDTDMEVCSAVQLIIPCPVSNMEASNRMDTVFKDWYEVFASSSLYHLHPDWQMHVMKLHEYWSQLLQLIDREQLRTCFFSMKLRILMKLQNVTPLSKVIYH